MIDPEDKAEGPGVLTGVYNRRAAHVLAQPMIPVIHNDPEFMAEYDAWLDYEAMRGNSMADVYVEDDSEDWE